MGDRLSLDQRSDQTAQSKGMGAVTLQTNFHHLFTPLLIVNGYFIRVNTLRSMLRNQHQGKMHMLLDLPQHMFHGEEEDK